MPRIVLKHPTLPATFQLVTDGTESEWKDAGWKRSSAKEAAAAGVELVPSDEAELDDSGDGVDLVLNDHTEPDEVAV